jgi:hypothetical protein
MANILLVDISKGFTWDILGDLHSFMYINNYILWDCITDAELTKFRILVNAIHIAISMDWVSGYLWDFVSGPGFGLLTLRGFSTWICYPDLLPGLGVLDPGSSLVSGLSLSFFSSKLSSRLCVCVWTWPLRIGPFASGLGVPTPVREHGSRGSFWPLISLLAPRGSPELEQLF